MSLYATKPSLTRQAFLSEITLTPLLKMSPMPCAIDNVPLVIVESS
jgi:hypothetical protein